MTHRIDRTVNTLEQSKRYTQKNREYWNGRDLQQILSYNSWENFENVIEKAIMACESTGINPKYHFHETMNMVEIGSGAKGKRKDYYLTRYACYLIAMNGATNKPEVATAQTYFAFQTRRQELQDELTDNERRIYLRKRIKNENRKLASAAKRAGVKRFPLFQDSGYRGLYDMSLNAIKSFKGIPNKDNLLDRAGRTELAANEFRITQTEDKIIRENIKGEDRAIDAHFNVGRKVRNTINELGGTMPENLAPEPPIKKIGSKHASNIKKLRK